MAQTKPEITDYIDQVRSMVPDVIAAGGGWLIADERFGDTSLLTDAEVDSLCEAHRDTLSVEEWHERFYQAATWVDADDLTAALALNPHITKADDLFSFDYEAIEKSLCALGATKAEADAATDILDIEGWGGIEYEMPQGVQQRHFTNDELLTMLLLVRDRAEGVLCEICGDDGEEEYKGRKLCRRCVQEMQDLEEVLKPHTGLEVIHDKS